MSSFKKLNKADITSVSYAANKNWSFRYSNNPNDAYAVYYTGSNISFNITGPFTANNQYSSLIYDQINHLFLNRLFLDYGMVGKTLRYKWFLSANMYDH